MGELYGIWITNVKKAMIKNTKGDISLLERKKGIQYQNIVFLEVIR